MNINWLVDLFENETKAKRLRYTAYGLIVLLLAADVAMYLVGYHAHTYFGIEGIPGFYAIFGAFSCWIIIVFSKYIGKKWIQKEEDYYDK